MNNKQQIINRAKELGFKFKGSNEYMELSGFSFFTEFILKIYTCNEWKYWDFYVEFKSKNGKLKHFNTIVYTLKDLEFFYQYYLYVSSRDIDNNLISDISDIIKDPDNLNWEVIETCRISDYIEYKLSPVEPMYTSHFHSHYSHSRDNNCSEFSQLVIFISMDGILFLLNI